MVPPLETALPHCCETQVGRLEDIYLGLLRQNARPLDDDAVATQSDSLS